MLFRIAHTLKRSHPRRLHEYVMSTHTTSYSLEYQRASVKYFTMDAAHLRIVSGLQVLIKRQSNFVSLLPLKSQTSLNFWKPFTSRSVQVFSKGDPKSYNDKLFAFADSDTCLVFDAPGILISQLTFAESKALADKKKCRLVYMHKNSDEVPCFQLQALSNVKTSTVSNITTKERAAVSPPSKRLPKSAVKEFKIQTTIGDHDLSIKLNQMKSLLVKGKQLKVHILSSKGAKSGKAAPVFIKQLTEELHDVCKLKQDFANDKETCIIVTPNETDKKEIQ